MSASGKRAYLQFPVSLLSMPGGEQRILENILAWSCYHLAQNIDRFAGDKRFGEQLIQDRLARLEIDVDDLPGSDLSDLELGLPEDGCSRASLFFALGQLGFGSNNSAGEAGCLRFIAQRRQEAESHVDRAETVEGGPASWARIRADIFRDTWQAVLSGDKKRMWTFKRFAIYAAVVSMCGHNAAVQVTHPQIQALASGHRPAAVRLGKVQADAKYTDKAVRLVLDWLENRNMMRRYQASARIVLFSLTLTPEQMAARNETTTEDGPVRKQKALEKRKAWNKEHLLRVSVAEQTQERRAEKNIDSKRVSLALNKKPLTPAVNLDDPMQKAARKKELDEELRILREMTE